MSTILEWKGKRGGEGKPVGLLGMTALGLSLPSSCREEGVKKVGGFNRSPYYNLSYHVIFIGVNQFDDA